MKRNENFKFQIIQNGNKSINIQYSKEKDKFYLLEEIYGKFIKEMIVLSNEFQQKEEIENIVIGIPSVYNEKEKEIIMKSCEIGGIERNKIKLINEQVCSLYEYCSLYPETMKKGYKAIVIDIGGNIMNVCCCEIIEKYEKDSIIRNIEIKSKGGNKRIGGQFIDTIVMKMIIHEIMKDKGEDMINKYLEIKEDDTEIMKMRKLIRKIKLLQIAERKKIDLSIDNEVSYDFILENIIDSNNNELNEIENDEELTIYLKREKFEEELKKYKIQLKK